MYNYLALHSEKVGNGPTTIVLPLQKQGPSFS